MRQTVYEDYKYCVQDVSRLYVGCKYTFSELLEAEEVAFKFQLLVQKYILPEADGEDTLESHLYYLDRRSFLVKLYGQLKARVKVNAIEEKRGMFARGEKAYVTKLLSVEELAGMTKEEKEACGLVVQELSVSKLAMAAL